MSELQERTRHMLISEQGYGDVSYVALCFSPNTPNDQIAGVLKHYGVERIMQPVLDTTNKGVVTFEQMARTREFEGIPRYENPEQPGNISILSAKGDCWLGLGGGCGFAVAAGDGILACLHIPRDGLLSQEAMRGDRRTELAETVPGAFVRWLASREKSPKQLSLRHYFGLPVNHYPHSFSDPRYGTRNQLLYSWLEKYYPRNSIFKKIGTAEHLDMAEWFMHVARELRFGNVGSAQPLRAGGDHAYTTHPEPGMHRKRNPTVLIRLS